LSQLDRTTGKSASGRIFISGTFIIILSRGTNYTKQIIMKLATLALLAGSAAAFAPSTNVAKTTALNSATQFENEVGVQAPLGLWDPLGCLNGIDQDTFDRYRYAEIKHGRVAQLAFLGHLITALGIRFPGYLSVSENILGIGFQEQ